MDVIEKAIRNAFEKGDSSDQAFRERVYRQAFAALDRVLQANPGVTVESAIRRRKSLQTKIFEIEQEFVHPKERPVQAAAPQPAPVVTPVAPAPVVPVAARPVQPAPVHPAPPVVAPTRPVEPPVQPQIRVEPPAVTLDAPEPPRQPSPETFQPEAFEPVITPERAAPANDAPAASEASMEALAAERVVPQSKRRRRPFAAMFVAVTLFSMLALGIWWAMQTGLLGNTAQPERFETVQPAGESFEPGQDEPPVEPGQADANRNWIRIFAGNDMAAISAPSNTNAEVLTDDGVNFVRIKSGDAGAAVMFDVTQGVLEQIAGKTVTFDIVARAQEGQETQMSVTCNFGEMGDCGRKRYAVGITKADFLFELDVPAKEPGSGGTIAINSDFDNAGKAVDIFEIRVSVNQ